MSEQLELAGYSLKEWSLIILLFILAVAVTVFVIGLAIAIQNNPNIVIKGEIDLSQFTAIVIGIAVVAITVVVQQLTAKQIVGAIKENDKVWLESEKP